MRATIEAVLADQGVITARAHPALSPTMRRLARAGLLANPLPGVFIATGETSALAWLRAVAQWSAPAGIIHDTSAAGLWLPSLADSTARLVHPTLRSRHRVVVVRRRVPPDFVREAMGLRVVTPAYAAAELAARDDGRSACEMLRLRLATFEELALATRALAGSRGQAERVRAIAACQDNPWSYAELRLHRILREAGFRDWVSNRPLDIGGCVFHPDARFRAARVIIEVDGRETHERPGQFRRDRETQNVYIAAGYLVIRFTWEHLDDVDYVVRVVREVLRLRGH
ncbi:endonuclease domain-containing protein [Propionicimonas sp.]|uniref:endonuclease domain-containing protein n=1 Tax=Propionicimonas sp. TaxID=1955623 RepID=UPI0039E6E5DC